MYELQLVGYKIPFLYDPGKIEWIVSQAVGLVGWRVVGWYEDAGAPWLPGSVTLKFQIDVGGGDPVLPYLIVSTILAGIIGFTIVWIGWEHVEEKRLETQQIIANAPQNYFNQCIQAGVPADQCNQTAQTIATNISKAQAQQTPGGFDWTQLLQWLPAIIILIIILYILGLFRR